MTANKTLSVRVNELALHVMDGHLLINFFGSSLKNRLNFMTLLCAKSGETEVMEWCLSALGQVS